MLSRLLRCAKDRLSSLLSIANQLVGRLTEPAHPTWQTSTLADLPRSRAELLADNARLRQ